MKCLIDNKNFGYDKSKFAPTKYQKLTFPLSSGVFPIAVPPLHKFEGTHGDRVAGDNTRYSHKKVSPPCYATRSRAKKSTLARSLVLIVELRRSLFSPPCGSRSVFERAE